ncbi:maleylpyruvate isomerase family mycothiol-dependent enzyme [Epidermidibacterium keratini]|uniref:Maleylpyruvate isomerase family mycothiol-dependent enzyme n=1 Tax=Epidermidibacterium keratini TaxID=1891644 RepID=A0A7L4YP18_9ACTN|nr:maleylpyruvate isomerase family mycothiol-dependent enzyme [Epidermidibacterium keratini]QHC00818.1 maleylpyruvate isomerase family mycothiol-dependent enzyme [Epidermidibacterium keratini]
MATDALSPLTDRQIWQFVHAERVALIDDLAGLSGEQWEVASLCAGWSVHDVAAHLISNATTRGRDILPAMLEARFDFHRMNETANAKARGASYAETLQRLRGVQSRTDGPPTWMAALPSRIVEEIVHGEDIRRPLGIARDYPMTAVLSAIEYQARTKGSIGGAKERVDGLSVCPDDFDAALGSGPAVRGRAIDLLMVLAGRNDSADQLHGPGADQLRSRRTA